MFDTFKDELKAEISKFKESRFFYHMWGKHKWRSRLVNLAVGLLVSLAFGWKGLLGALVGIAFSNVKAAIEEVYGNSEE